MEMPDQNTYDQSQNGCQDHHTNNDPNFCRAPFLLQLFIIWCWQECDSLVPVLVLTEKRGKSKFSANFSVSKMSNLFFLTIYELKLCVNPTLCVKVRIIVVLLIRLFCIWFELKTFIIQVNEWRKSKCRWINSTWVERSTFCDDMHDAWKAADH